MKTNRSEMNAATLTNRIFAILAVAPATCDDVLDRLRDSGVRRSDVANELAALCADGRATLSYPMIAQSYQRAT